MHAAWMEGTTVASVCKYPSSMSCILVRASPRVPYPKLSFLFFFDKNRKNLPQQFAIPGCHLCQVQKKSLRVRIYARSYPRRIRPYQKRWKDIKIILFLSQVPDVSFHEVEGHKHNLFLSRVSDVSYIWVWQVNYAKLLEMGSFFTWHIFLEVGKTQDITSKIWQTLGDALTRLLDASF